MRIELSKVTAAEELKPKKGMKVSIEVEGVTLKGKITEIKKSAGKIVVVAPFRKRAFRG